MMRSIRLDDELESQLEQVARIEGQPVSGVIRDAVRRHCRAILSDRLDTLLGDVIGSVSFKGRGRDAHRDFRSAVVRKHTRRRKLRKRS